MRKLKDENGVRGRDDMEFGGFLPTFYFQLWHTFKMFSVSCYKSLIVNYHDDCDQEIHFADLIGLGGSSN
jgi:hypothetical protein